jgi:hypothetical protein
MQCERGGERGLEREIVMQAERLGESERDRGIVRARERISSISLLKFAIHAHTQNLKIFRFSLAFRKHQLLECRR